MNAHIPNFYSDGTQPGGHHARHLELTDVAGSVVRLCPHNERAQGIIEQWGFCMTQDAGGHCHYMLRLVDLRHYPTARMTDAMTHIIMMSPIIEPFAHGENANFAEPCVAFQFPAPHTGQVARLQCVMKSLAEDVISGVLPAMVHDDDGRAVWSEYVTFYLQKPYPELKPV